MKIIKPYAKILDLPDREAGIKLLKKIEWCARISHRSEDAQTDDSWERIIQSVVMNHCDFSVIEHASVSVDAVMDRGISHEWVRHRLFSFTQSSTRFINHTKKIPPEFIQPELSEEVERAYNGEQIELSPQQLWQHSINTAENTYRKLIEAGYAPQIARSVLPNSLSTRIITSGNLRNWRHFLLMRTTKETHPQMREITIPLLEEFRAKIPLLFDDIIPLATQRENLRLPR